MRLADSHCHLDLLTEDVETVLAAAKEQGVEYFLCVSVTLEDFPAMLKLIEPYPNVYASVGLHPNEENITQEPTVAELVALAAHEKVLAIGETGLDYYRSQGDLSWQQERFRRHIQAAKEINKPIIVHSRQAREDTIKILRAENAAAVGGVLHCFTEDMAMATAAMELNFYISFSGIVTFSNAKEVQAVAQQMPLTRMLIETDAPYLAPVPLRGQANQPAYVRYVAEHIAKLRGVPVDEIATATTQNFLQLFQVK